jgi:hypothetical protein
LADVLKLEKQFTQENPFYKYEQLHDLQSRLMLVAGKAEKGKDDVDRFMLVFVFFFVHCLGVETIQN